MLKKRLTAILCALCLATVAGGATGCSGGGGNSSTASTTSAPQDGNGPSTITEAPTEPQTETTAAPSGEDYGLAELAGQTPEVGDPVQKDGKGDAVLTEDGQWIIDNCSTIGQDGTVTVNVQGDGGVAISAEKSLGTEWKVEANFIPIQAYPAEQPTCARLFINNAEGAEVVLLTVNFINKMEAENTNTVEIALQYNNGRSWRSLYTGEGWINTTSTAFHFSLSRAEGSDKLTFEVTGDQGELVNRETLVGLPEELVDTPVAAGVGVYASAVQYSDIVVESNGSEAFTYNGISVT